jgi:HSP20 family protein
MPWDSMHDLVSLPGRLADRSGGVWAPPVDLYETADRYVLIAEVPGFSSADFTINATSDSLTISGRRPPLDVEAQQYLRLERGQGDFSRTFSFPEAIGTGDIGAQLRDGLLTVTIPKADCSSPRRVDIG